LNPEKRSSFATGPARGPVLLLLAAGQGTRFGIAPKCAQSVNGVPLARYDIDAFRQFAGSPVVCVVGYRREEVMRALGREPIYIWSENPTAGTAFAAYEAFSLAELEQQNPVLLVAMGDRIVPSAMFQKVYETHVSGPREAELTLLVARQSSPHNFGKGRVQRGEDGRVRRIVEQREIDALTGSAEREALAGVSETNCALYALRARLLRRHLEVAHNRNAQRQYYLTDIVEGIHRQGGEIRTVATTPADAEYDLLCLDVTHPEDLGRLAEILRVLKHPPGEGPNSA
jgi:bifunctional UDP-N-acetylglucosamine pyrophosphorylase / glucosamine-1-phosphate N-acetyltransferase